MRYLKIFSLFLLITVTGKAQNIALLASNKTVSLRGLSVVTDQVLWASGSNGMVAKSTDGGKSFQWMQVSNFEKRDFRDIEAFDSNTAIIMAAAEPALILKTRNGGKSWYKVFEDSTQGMFLDAMDFHGDDGVVIGDPINQHVFEAYTTDAGEHWKIIIPKDSVAKGEAFFAASGTNAKLLGIDNQNPAILFVSGGTLSRFFFNEYASVLPLMQGKESAGANSIAIHPFNKNIYVVGGDFSKDTVSQMNACYSTDKGRTWQQPVTPPHGYRSCVIYLSAETLLTCGTSGVDISYDGGRNWQLISTESFHVAQKAKKGNTVFMAGSKGKIAVLHF
ncbi:MAG: oxidoreductase [Bacteroidota bacterium]|nr:oxidoreductase [Bacteroidota bacterium]